MKKQYSNKSGKKASGHYSLGNKKQARKPLITALEPRLLLDGAAVATAIDVLTDSQLHDASQTDNSHQGSDTSFVVAPTEVRAVDPSLNNGKKEVVFIEDNVADYQSLIDGANAGVEVVLLDSTQDGLSQMAEWAKTHSDYDAIHLISHGSEGQLNLGGLTLDASTVNTRSDDLAQLGAALNEEGDLLFYGCSVASGEGQDFIEALAQATKADVAASDDLTGAASLGGDWELEYISQEGVIQTSVFSSITAPSNWIHALTVADENYDDDAKGVTTSNDGWTYTSNDSGATLNIADALDFTGLSYSYQSSGENSQTEISFKTTDGSEFKLNSFNIGRGLGDFSGLVIKGFKNNSEVATNTPLTSGDTYFFNVSENTAWQNIDEIRIYGNDLDIELDNIDVSDPVQSNSAPTISNAPSDITVTEDTASNVDLSGVTFADGDGDNLTVTLTASAGTLAASSGGNVTVSNSGTGTLTLSGTAANINTYLDTTTNIQYTGASNASGDNAATISIKANDGTTDSTISTVNINITEVNDEPTLTATPLNPTFTEGGADVTLFNNPNASTVEAGQTIEQLTLTVSNISDLGNEFLTFGSVNIALQDNQSASHTSPAVFSYTVSLTGTTATVTINASDTAAVWQNYVPFLKYKNTSEAPTEGNRVVTLTSITDSGSNTGANDNVADLSIASTVAVVQVPAVVASVAATTSNGSYNEGDVIAITVTFDDAVTVTGTPQLILETGSEDRVVDYVFGSGSNTLTFNYTVQAGDTSADLDYISTSALTLNGGSIKDAGGYDATLTLATPGASDSLGANKAIVIDTTAPSSPTTPDMTAGTDSGTSSTDDITNDTTPTVTGTAEAGATVVLYDTDGTTSLGSATADGSGNWSITSSELSTGSHTLTTKATDTAGNVSVASSGLTITVDDTAPTLSSSNPADGAVSVAPSGDITLTFSEDIAKGYDEITLINVTTGTTVETFDVLNGGNLTYSGNTVTLNPVSDLDEATTYAIRIDGNAVRDTAGNTYAGISDNTTLNFTTGVTDSAAPTFLSIQRADDDVVNSDTTSFTLTFNEAVTAVAGDFELNTTGTAAGTIGTITGSGTNTLTVNVTGVSGVGTLGLNLKSDHAVTDAAGNALATAEPSDDEVYTVDTVAPTLISINRVDSATTNADSVQFIAVFSETVTGLGIDDFELTGTATNGANISSVTGTGNGFVITISGVDGDGTLGVQLKSAATVNDIAGNALTATTPSALLETYTIENTAPTATAIITTNTALSTADSVTFDVTFSEAVTNVSMDDFEISGDVTGAISAVSGSGSSYTVTVSNIVGDGALGLNFNSGQNIIDIAGNALAGTEPATDESYTIDNTLPTVTSISRGMVNQVAAGTATDVVFTVVFNETVSGLATGDFAVTGNAANTGVSSVSSADGKVFTVTVSGVNGSIGQTVGLSFTGSVNDAVNQTSTAQFTAGDHYTIAGTLLNEGALSQAQLDAIVDLNREGTLLEQSVADAKQVIVIDSRVPGLVELTKQVNPEADIWLLDGSRSATEQITEILANYSDLDALHILSHGGVGEIYLGAETVSAEAINQNSATYAAWGNALSDSGDILLYGCNVAQGDMG
ncbi:MAG: DUF4347 domain-containing protein, partial [Gammaproteobacteria bacterium]|nr:DUF4347 domain-containing protein [Gammaproteobacteria bacterium]